MSDNYAVDQAVGVIAVLRAKSGRGSDLEAKLREAIPLVRREPGCLAYHLHVDRNDPEKFVMVETWEDQNALNVHGNADAFKKLSSHFDDLLGEPLGLTLLRRID